MTEQEILNIYKSYHTVSAITNIAFGMTVAVLCSYIGYKANEKRIALAGIILGMAICFYSIPTLIVPEYKAISMMVEK